MCTLPQELQALGEAVGTVSRGLPDAVAAALPQKPYSPARRASAQDEQCAISPLLCQSVCISPQLWSFSSSAEPVWGPAASRGGWNRNCEQHDSCESSCHNCHPPS